jgi:UDP-N-acetylglucosamine acyltransferase
MKKIHPTALVSKEAELGEGVEIGPYAIVGPQVKIGRQSQIGSHVVLEGQTHIGERCRLFTGVCIGFPAQTRQSETVRSTVIIGNDNLLREYVTVNAGMKEGSTTRVGDRNTLMINSHVAHDCVLGNDIVMANSVALAGHVQVEDGAVIGGLVGVHQFVRIGKLAMVGGLSKVVMDVAPFSISDGQPAEFCGVNAVGLRRAGVKSSQMTEIKTALKMLLGARVNFSRAIPLVRKKFSGNADVQYLLAFIEKSKRGVAR